MGHRILINVHNVQQAYGGPEEGGWWYDKGTFLEALFTDLCVCYLPLVMVVENIQLDRHEDNCGLHALVAQTRQRYAGHLEEWILEEPGDCSPERPGEDFKTGVIRVSLSAHQGHSHPGLRTGETGGEHTGLGHPRIWRRLSDLKYLGRVIQGAARQ
jgi:hypothetical protein